MADEQVTEPTTDESDATPTEVDGQSPPTDDLGDAGKRALDEERKARRAEAKRAKELETRLREFEDAGKSEQQKLLDRLKAAENEANGLRAEASRQRVANKYGLGDLASVLSGDEDAMEETAKLLQKRLKAAAPDPAPIRFDGGPRTPVKAGKDMNELILGLKRR